MYAVLSELHSFLLVIMEIETRVIVKACYKELISMNAKYGYKKFLGKSSTVSSFDKAAHPSSSSSEGRRRGISPQLSRKKKLHEQE